MNIYFTVMIVLLVDSVYVTARHLRSTTLTEIILKSGPLWSAEPRKRHLVLARPVEFCLYQLYCTFKT